MTALADLKSRIADELNRTDMTSQIALAITTACAAYAPFRLLHNESSGSFTTIASTGEYTTSTAAPGTLPSDIVQLDSVRITVASNRYLLRPTTWHEIDEADSSPTLTGRPTFYAWYDEGLRLYPVPDGAYVIDLRYLATVAEETWATRAEALIRSRAKKELYLHVLFDPQQAAVMERIEGQELAALKRRAFHQQGSGFVQPHN